MMHLQTTPSKQVCCCGADCWTKVLAWLQTITATISSIAITSALITIGIVGAKKVDEFMADEQIPTPYRHVTFGPILGIVGGLLSLSLLHLLMGIILLKGANERKSEYLTSWIVYSVTLVVIQVILKLVTLQTSNLIGVLISIGLTVAINGFLIWIVHTFRREVQADAHLGVGVGVGHQEKTKEVGFTTYGNYGYNYGHKA